MCDPLTATAVALTAAGAGVNSYESNRTQKAMINARNAATAAELERQRAFQATSDAEFKRTSDAFTPEQQAAKLTEAQNSVASSAFTANAPTAEMVGSIGTGGAPRVVQTNEDRTLGDAFTKGAKSNGALAKVAGWDQRAFGNNLALNQSGRNLDLTADLAKTSAAVGGLEQNAAYKNAYRPNSGIGDLMQFAGQVAGFQGGKGGGSIFGGSKTPTPAAFDPTRLGSLY